jgi:hypothetical protein
MDSGHNISAEPSQVGWAISLLSPIKNNDTNKISFQLYQIQPFLSKFWHNLTFSASPNYESI